MHIRDYSLPNGWYPRDPKEAERTITGYLPFIENHKDGALACIVPHAGWYYSGYLAAMGIMALSKDADTVAVIGGHLPGNYPALFAPEDAVRTPFGNLPIDKELRFQFMKDLEALYTNGCKDDQYKDNTVEVLLPLARYFFPKANLLWIRLSACIDSYNAGKSLFKTAEKTGRKIVVAGSSDLTHYGSHYGFSPHGRGKNALKWVREVNDAAFIKAVESGDPEEVLLRAEQDASSCSAGAVLGAMGFAAAADCKNAKLLEYGTSADVAGSNDAGTNAAGTDATGIIPDSFVGYAAMGFYK